jgi:hypothetical protein
MNRKNLTAAVLAGLAGAAGIVGSAQAVNINPDGLGQVLIYPYYTTNNNNITLLSVVNTSENAKAVKVRFMEGQNTREVLDFNLYMSAWDVWTASISMNADGVPELQTADTSCTVPYLFGNGGTQEFLPYALTDGGSTDIVRATEGHFEMIEMGTLTNESEGSADAATHSEGVPADCQQLVDAWTDPDDTVAGDEGYWLASPFTDMDAPSGGLFGGAAIVNVEGANMASYDATAINGFATDVLANDILHQEPGSVLPSLNSGDVNDGTVFLDNGATQNSGQLARGVDAVSYVFMHDQIMNEYTTEADTLARTEWVVTFPTKHFYVYAPSAGGSDVPVAPFTTVWDSESDDPRACEVVLLDTIWDREERTIVNPDVPGGEVPPIVSPRPPGEIIDPDPIQPFQLCYETSVIAFGEPMLVTVDDVDVPAPQSPMLGSYNYHTVDNSVLGFDYGWARLQLDDYPHDANLDGVIDANEEMFTRADLGGLQGLPVAGFAVQTFRNGFLGEGGATIGNYGGIYQHKSTRKPGSDAGFGPGDIPAPPAQ